MQWTILKLLMKQCLRLASYTFLLLRVWKDVFGRVFDCRMWPASYSVVSLSYAALVTNPCIFMHDWKRPAPVLSRSDFFTDPALGSEVPGGLGTSS